MSSNDKGVLVTPTQIVTPQQQWKEVGSITASQATLAVGARDYSAVVGLTATKTAIWTVPNDITGAFFRFQTTANADASVVEAWVAAHNWYDDDSTEDSFMLGCILTLTGGQQVGPSSNVFMDTIVKTASTGVLAEGTVLDSAADRIAMYRLDLQGYKRVVWIATTLEGGTTLTVDARGY